MKTDFPEKYITLGLKIAYYRRKAGYTQEYLAKLMGKSVSFIRQIEERVRFAVFLWKRCLRFQRY